MSENGDYISREAIINLVEDDGCKCEIDLGWPDGNMAFVEMIKEIPAADVRPVVRGEWEHTEGFDDYGGGRYVEWTCSVCFSKAKGGWAVRDEHIDEPPAWNFCPNCGADMREES